MTRTAIVPAAVAAAVRQSLPADVVRGLPPAVASSLIASGFSPQFDDGAAPMPPMTSIDLRPGAIVGRDDLDAALAAVGRSMEPGGGAPAIASLARLRLATRHRELSDTDEELTLTLFAEKAGQYPADAVAMACERWAETQVFWPSLAELLSMCEWAMSARRSLRMALLQAKNALPRD